MINRTSRAAVACALLATTCLTAPVMAQQAAQTSGEALSTPSYNPVDANGVDLLSGRFSTRSPALSMGGADNPTSFYFSWTGQLWMPNTPRLWLDKDWHVIVEHDGVSEEFADAIKTGETNPNGWGTHFRYKQKRPNLGSSLSCYITGGLSGNGWISQCDYTSRQGVNVTFYGNLPSNGGYPTAAQYDNEAFGNTRTWPAVVSDPARGKTSYGFNIPMQTYGFSNSGRVNASHPNGISVAKDNASYYSNSINFVMSNRGVPGTARALNIRTPSLDGKDSTKSYLRPKSTVQSFTDPLGRITSYTFNSNGDMTRVVTPGGVTADIGYDGDHRVTSYTQNGKRWSYSYNFGAKSTGTGTTTVTNPDGYSKSVTHSARPGPVTASRDEFGRVTTYQHDSYDRLTHINRPTDQGTTYLASYYEYDTRGNLKQITGYSKSGLSRETQVTRAEYPVECVAGNWCNKPSKIIDPRGNATDIAYDPATSLPATVTRPAGLDGVRPQTRNTYVTMGFWFKDSNGNPVQDTFFKLPRLTETATCMTQVSCVGESDETKTVYEFGFRDGTAANNLEPVSVTRKLGSDIVLARSELMYDAVGNTTYIDGPLAGTADTTRMIWDAARQKVGEIGPASGNGQPPLATRTRYNGDGQLILAEQGNVPDQSDTGWSQFTVSQRAASAYDGAGRLATAAIAGAGAPLSVTQTNYDSFGRPRCIATRMNEASFPTINANGAISGGSLPPDACAADLDGSAGPDRVTLTEYDQIGQPTTITRALGTDERQVYARYTWNVAGKRTSVTDAKGNLATMEYDGFDRQIRWTFPSPAVAGQVNADDYEAYGYDAAGNRMSLRKRDGREFSLSYDALNRVTSKIVPDACVTGFSCTPAPAAATRDVYYGYDLRGLQKYARFDGFDGEGIVTSYDGLGRPSASTTALAGTSRTLRFDFDTNGNRTSVTHPDNQVFETTYDAVNRPTSTRQTDGQTVDVATYNARGYQSARFDGLATYAHDAIGRVSSLDIALAGTAQDLTTEFAYNPASQIVTQTRSNDAYAYSGRVNGSQAYAVNGLNQYTGVGAASLTYDANGNLTSDGATSYTYDAENRLVQSSTGAQLTYDPLGRLFQTSGRSGTTQFLYDGDQLTAEYNGAGGLLRRYIHGPGNDDPMLWYEGVGLGDRRLLFADSQGSIVAVSDASGNAVATNSYDEYGTPKIGNQGRFQYTGQAWIPELGLYHYKARVYSPKLGRFLQTDPIGYDDQINLYTYVGSDPINANDPSGQRCAPLNRSSAYCARSNLYARIDSRLSSRTRFFGAASMTTNFLGNLDIPGFNRFASSGSSRAFMSQLSSKLQDFNSQVVSSIDSGRLSGANLDTRLVNAEQTQVQQSLDGLKKRNLTQYNNLISESNRFLNPNTFDRLVLSTEVNDRRYLGVLDQVRSSLGRDFNFANQFDREMIGIGAIGFLRGQ